MIAAALAFSLAGALAQDVKPPVPPKEGIKAFSDVITKEAKSDSGLFNVYRF
jgi:hypothetical protein